MKIINFKLLILTSIIFLNNNSAIAQSSNYNSGQEFANPGSFEIKEDNEEVDRSYRTNSYPNTPSYAQGGDTSRYSTNQGWSRGNQFGYFWGGWGGFGYNNHSSDIPTTGYNTPRNNYNYINRPSNYNNENYGSYVPFIGGYHNTGYNTPNRGNCGNRRN